MTGVRESGSSGEKGERPINLEGCTPA